MIQLIEYFFRPPRLYNPQQAFEFSSFTVSLSSDSSFEKDSDKGKITFSPMGRLSLCFLGRGRSPHQRLSAQDDTWAITEGFFRTHILLILIRYNLGKSALTLRIFTQSVHGTIPGTLQPPCEAVSVFGNDEQVCRSLFLSLVSVFSFAPSMSISYGMVAQFQPLVTNVNLSSVRPKFYFHRRQVWG